MQRASKREECYTARDAYHKCLDEHGAGSSQCDSVKAVFEERCPASWQSYFNQQRERLGLLELQADISRQKAGRE